MTKENQFGGAAYQRHLKKEGVPEETSENRGKNEQEARKFLEQTQEILDGSITTILETLIDLPKKLKEPASERADVIDKFALADRQLVWDTVRKISTQASEIKDGNMSDRKNLKKIIDLYLLFQKLFEYSKDK